MLARDLNPDRLMTYLGDCLFKHRLKPDTVGHVQNANNDEIFVAELKASTGEIAMSHTLSVGEFDKRYALDRPSARYHTFYAKRAGKYVAAFISPTFTRQWSRGFCRHSYALTTGKGPIRDFTRCGMFEITDFSRIFHPKDNDANEVLDRMKEGFGSVLSPFVAVDKDGVVWVKQLRVGTWRDNGVVLDEGFNHYMGPLMRDNINVLGVEP